MTSLILVVFMLPGDIEPVMTVAADQVTACGIVRRAKEKGGTSAAYLLEASGDYYAYLTKSEVKCEPIAQEKK